MTSDRSARPLPALLVAASVLALEGLASVAFGISEALHINASRLVVGLGATLLIFGYGAFLGAVAWALGRGRRWSRGPAIATQLLHLPIAWSFRDGGTWWVAVLLGVAAVVTLVCVLLPSSTAVLVDGDEGPSDAGT